MTTKPLVDAISALLTERGWSLSELGRRSGLDPSLLSRLQSGEREWRLDHLDAVARAFEKSLEQLLKGTDREALLAEKRYAEEHAPADLKAMAEKLAETLAAHCALEAAYRALEEELRQRPTREQLQELQGELAGERTRRSIIAKQLQKLAKEHNELRTQLIVATAKASELEKALAAMTKQAAELRKAAIKWKNAAKDLGGKVEVATIAALGAFGFALSKSTPRRRS